MSTKRLTKTEQAVIAACDAAPKTGPELRSLTRGRARLADMERRGLLRSGLRRGEAVWSVPDAADDIDDAIDFGHSN